MLTRENILLLVLIIVLSMFLSVYAACGASTEMRVEVKVLNCGGPDLASIQTHCEKDDLCCVFLERAYEQKKED